MKIVRLRYVTRTKTGSYEYRRQVPKALRAKIGKFEIKRVLGQSEARAIREYSAFHDQVERLLAAAKLPEVNLTTLRNSPKTAMDDYREALARLKAVGIDPTEPLYSEPGEVTQADLLADHWVINDTADSEAIRMLTGVGKVKPPVATFMDASRLYVTTKIEGRPDEHRKRLRNERVSGFVTTALGKDPKLTDMTRTHAREVVAEMLASGAKPETVDRYCNDIRAIINFGITEYELERQAINPFVKIDIKGLKTDNETDRDERSPFTKAQLKATRAFILDHAGSELKLIWRLLEGTGMRLSEASGLEVQDIALDSDTPHLDLRFNRIRRLKNKSSIRLVPLVGDALDAAREALDGRSGSSEAVFRKYGKPGGGNVASAALMKNLRKVVKDPKVTVHSLRHTLQDRMIVAGISEHDRHIILGHSVTGEANRYGSKEARLVATAEAMKMLLPSKARRD